MQPRPAYRGHQAAERSAVVETGVPVDVDELEGSRRRTGLGPQCRHKRADLTVGQCGMVFDLAYFPRRPQQVFEMTAPA